MSAEFRRGPWAAEHLLRWAVTSCAGFAVMITAWYVLSGHASVKGEVPGANLAVAGLVVACYAQFSLLMRARRQIAIRAATVYDLLAESRGGEVAVPDPDALVGGPGLQHYHRPSCVFAADRGWPPQAEEQHRAAGRVPCGACRP